MKYNIQNINTKNGFIFFWGHQLSKDGTITKSCFSQWWLSSFKDNEIEYKTAEHYMMSKKAELFNDYETLNKILKSQNPKEAKKLGREIKNYNENIWVENRFKIVKNGNLLKFNQNIELKKFLLKTENKIIVEASPVDSIWGIGMHENHININNPQKWKGLSLLGFALMEVRDEINNFIDLSF